MNTIAGRPRVAPILSQSEMKRFLRATDLRSPIGYRDRALFEILYSTGLRAEEIFKLKIADVDLKDALVRVSRSRRKQPLPLSSAAVSYTREYLEKIRPRWAKLMAGDDDGTLLLNYTGSRLSPDTLRYAIERTLKAARMDKKAVKPATFRCSIAAHLAENGMDRLSIAEFLGPAAEPR